MIKYKKYVYIIDIYIDLYIQHIYIQKYIV